MRSTHKSQSGGTYLQQEAPLTLQGDLMQDGAVLSQSQGQLQDCIGFRHPVRSHAPLQASSCSRRLQLKQDALPVPRCCGQVCPRLPPYALCQLLLGLRQLQQLLFTVHTAEYLALAHSTSDLGQQSIRMLPHVIAAVSCCRLQMMQPSDQANGSWPFLWTLHKHVPLRAITSKHLLS